jgi:hypothetical protein
MADPNSEANLALLDDDQVSPESVQAGHELSEANAPGLMGFFIGLTLGAIVMYLSIGAFFFALRRHEPEHLAQNALPPEPRLQTDPPGDFRRYLERENLKLSTYGWVDPKAGIAHIPIERAMDLLIEKAACGRPGGAP